MEYPVFRRLPAGAWGRYALAPGWIRFGCGDEETRVEIGGFRVDAVIDGEGSLRPDEALPRVAAAAWGRHRTLLDEAGMLPVAVGGLLLRGHGRIVLVDLGYGEGALGAIRTGRLLVSLHLLGVEPADVTDVLFTHLHRDHIGWASTGGVPTFPGARLCCGAADRRYFLEQRRDPDVVERVRPCLDRLVTFEDGVNVPGIAGVPAPGHTPGSTILTVSDGDRRLTLLGDIAHFPVQLLEPGWATPWDVDVDQARRRREHVVRAAVDNPSWLVGAHFPQMRAGRVLDGGRGLRWET
jgi:glyoxylase-like metal-dependent hydrolase (beta-lactamase superfamily II)